jgi:hypothetical protein
MRPALRRGAGGVRPGLGAWSLALAGLAIVAVGPRVFAQDRPSQPGPWQSLAVPGGTADLLAAAGLDPDRPRTTALLDIIRIIHDVPVGTLPEVDERRAHVLSHLDAVGARRPARGEATAERPADAVPLPVSERTWRTVTRTSGRTSSSLVRAILGDRRASLLYFGLCAMDEETRRYLDARPALLQAIYDSDRAAVLALHGRSLHVRGDAVAPPGGPAAAALWEAAAGEPLTRADAFIASALGKDGGRLALLFDAVAHMDEPRQRFALGLWIDDSTRRLERFKALYAACAAGLSNWQPAIRPFFRGLYDPAQILLITPVSPDGRPGPLGWKSFWQRALAPGGVPAQPRDELADVEHDGPLDAAALLETIYRKRDVPRHLVAEAWCFGQRVFGTVSRDSLPDVLVAVRGFGRYRSLVLTLERLGIGEPSVYAAAVQRAERIAQVGDAQRASTALSLYQGALALVERARLGRKLGASAASDLVGSLARLPLSPAGDDLGAVGAWVDTRFLPAIGVTLPAADGGPTLEVQVLSAFAGRLTQQRPPDRVVEYEGARYRVDPAGFELARMEAVREKQRQASLDAALAFVREVRGLTDGIGSQAELSSRLARLDAAAAPLLASRARAVPDWKGGAMMRAMLTDAARDLDAVRRAGDVHTVGERVSRLSRTADRLLGRILVSLAYAAVLPEPNGLALMAGDPSLVHDWGQPDADPASRARAAWALPSDNRDSTERWRVHGSVLALDLCFGAQALRRLSADAPTAPPTIADDDRRGFTDAAVLSNSFDQRDEDMRRLAAAVRRGRDRVAGLSADPTRWADVAAAAGLDEARRELLSWAVVHEPNRAAGFFSVGDLLRLGGQARPGPSGLDAWGAAGTSYDGRLSLQFPASQPFATFAGRRMRGVMTGLVPDLALLVGELLDERRLPASLARSVLMVATLDYLDRASLAYDDDWMTMVADVQRILPSRMDDYLASVTTAGPLVPLPLAMEGDRK